MQFFTALVTPDQTTFSQTFARNDWIVFSSEFKHEEGALAGLSLEIKNPGFGLLSGLTHVWFSYKPVGSTDAVPLFFGQVEELPGSVFNDETITVELTARPVDFEAQKLALANTLRVLPWWDAALIDEQSRSDNDAVLEARTASWHIDPVTHAVTISDWLIGEDGEIEFAESETFYDGFDFSLTSDKPVPAVSMDAMFTWTQTGQGTVDLTNAILPSVASSYTFTADNWPKPGSALGTGWTVAASFARAGSNLQVLHKEISGETVATWFDGDKVTVSSSKSDDYLLPKPDGIYLPPIYTQRETDIAFGPDGEGGVMTTSYKVSASWTDGIVPINTIAAASLVAQYDAQRTYQERVTFTLVADVQSVVTGSQYALALSPLKSANLSEPIGDEIPIGDPKLRSYVCTDRGNLSIQYLLLLARATLIRRARAAEPKFSPVLSRLGDINLRRTALINDPRFPGGQATGKIIGWEFKVDGDSGTADIVVTLGCAVGEGSELTTAGGEPVYIDDDYIDDDYQEHVGEIISFAGDDIVYGPPQFAPLDDGFDPLGQLKTADALAEAVTLENGLAAQATVIEAALEGWKKASGTGKVTIRETNEEWQSAQQAMIQARSQAVQDILKSVQTNVTVKLKSMRAKFETEVAIDVAELSVPMMLDLAS